MVFIVLRHGQSCWNKENRFTGWSEVKLSPRGIEEAKHAGKLLKKYNFDKIFVSSMVRTRDTLKYCLGEKFDENKEKVIFF